MGVVWGQTEPYAGFRAAYAPVDRLAVVAGGMGNDRLTLGSLGVRYNFFEHVHANLAVMAFGTAFLLGDGGYHLDSYLAGTGVAADVGGSRVRFDATIPVVGAMVNPRQDRTDRLPGLLSFEAGVSLIGEEGHGKLRVGATGPTASVSYRWAEPRWYAEAGISSALFVNEMHVGVGTVF